MSYNIAQRRAKHALDQINRYIEANNDNHTVQKELLSYINSMGPMILMNGFGQTCAFYLSSKKDEHISALMMLEQWFDHRDCNAYSNARQQPMMEKIVHGSANEYQLAQAEAIAYLDWLKKFAKAFLKVDQKKEGDDATPAN